MRRIWVDTDMGFDDLAAIAMLDADPGISIAGISLVAGNAGLAQVVENARRARAFLGWDAPLHAGSDRPLAGRTPATASSVLGSAGMPTVGACLPPAGDAVPAEDAIAALARFLASDQGGEVLALGPLTNLALLARAEPRAARRIRRLTWMGGSAGPGNHTAAAEFNAFADPEAAQAVLDAGVPLRMVGLDACRPVTVSVRDAEDLRAVGGERAVVLGDLLEGYARIGGGNSHALYDPVAAAALVDAGAVHFRRAHLAMELDGTLTRGMSVVEWRVPRRAEANAEIATEPDVPFVRGLVMAALGRAAAAPRTLRSA